MSPLESSSAVEFKGEAWGVTVTLQDHNDHANMDRENPGWSVDEKVTHRDD